MKPGFAYYQDVDLFICVVLALLGVIGTLVIKNRRNEYPICFMITSAILVIMWFGLSNTDNTWSFWEKAYIIGDDKGAGRILFKEKAISYVSERVFNNVLIAISSVLVISTFLWDSFIRYIGIRKFTNGTDSHDTVKNTDIGLFYYSCVCIFLVQIIVSYYWPSGIFLLSAQNIGFIKNGLRIIISIAPIGLSFYFCNKFWNKLEEELKQNKFSDSIYPTLMVAQGTFYTFVGVSAILLTYTGGKNVDVILQGLKLAFLTSVVGLLYSIAARFKIKYAVDKHYNEVKDKDISARVNSNESGIAVPDYLDERDFYVVLKNIDKSLAKFSNELVNANEACLRKQANVFEERLEVVFKGLKEDMENIASLSSDIKNNFEVQKELSVSLRTEMQNLWNKAHGAYQNIDATAQSFNNFLENCKVESLAPTINQVTALVGLTERLTNDADIMAKKVNNNLEKINSNSEKIVSWTENIDSNINKAMTADKDLYDKFNSWIFNVNDNINIAMSADEKLSAKIEAWTSDIKYNLDTILVADEQLSKAFINYKNKVEQIDLEKIAYLLTELKSNYDELANMQSQDANLYAAHKETIEQQVSLLKAAVHAQQVALEEQQNIIKAQEEQAEKVIDERQKTISLITDKREAALNETISNMKCIDVSMGYAGDAISNLQERLNFDADQVCESIAEIGQGILGKNVAIAQETYKQLLAEQKKYLENLEDLRNKTMEASLDVTCEVLKKVTELKDSSEKL